MFLKYPDIERYDNKNCLIKNFSTGSFEISEKIDGSNCSIVVNENGDLEFGKRNSNIFEGKDDKSFSGVIKWAKEKDWTELPLIPPFIVFGEMVKISERSDGSPRCANKIQYKKADPFVAYEIYFPVKDIYASVHSSLSLPAWLSTVPIWKTTERIDYEELLKTMPKNSLYSEGDKIEGIIIKRLELNSDDVFAFVIERSKIVSEEFREIKGIKKLRGNTYEEIAESVCTLNRISKIMQKGNYYNNEDIGKIIKETIEDAFKEEENALKDLCWKEAKKNIGKAFPNVIRKHIFEIFKEQVLENAHNN